MSENRPHRSRSRARDRRAHWRLRALFLARLARLARLRARLTQATQQDRVLVAQALCSTLGDCHRLGIASQALRNLDRQRRAAIRHRQTRADPPAPAA